LSKVIAIDGPAASGKSSVAKALAARFGVTHVNSGLMYRAATRAVISEGIDPEDTEAVDHYIGAVDTAAKTEADGELSITIGGKVRKDLNTEDVNALVSAVSRAPLVRERMVALQRRMVESVPTIMEGRDIGSVVFPDTKFKFYVTASEEVRAARRAAEGLTDQVAERDKADSTRKSSPLTVAKDATVIDSSDLTLEETVDAIAALLEEKGWS